MPIQSIPIESISQNSARRLRIDTALNYFLGIYGSLPRAGPGSREATRQAFEMMKGLPERPRILDIGCGPGVQTMDLLRLCDGTIVALDLLPWMLERTKQAAQDEGVLDRVELVQKDMQELDFAQDSFDIIWSEGAIYNLGFSNGLEKIKPLVRPGGYVAVTEVVWLDASPPQSVLEYWRQYPEIDTLDNKLVVIDRLGYEPIGHFVLPSSAWTTDYYDPMAQLVADKSKEWAGLPEAEAVLREATDEIEMYRQHGNCFGYAFFVMRKPGCF